MIPDCSSAPVSKYSTVVRIVFGISLKNVLANAVAYTPISNKAPPAASNAKNLCVES